MAQIADPTFTQTSPILRMYDESAALAFYLGYLGFTQDWDHRY